MQWIMRSTNILVNVNSKKVAVYMLYTWEMHISKKISRPLNIYKIFAEDKNKIFV